MKIEGSNILITGGAKGIGLAYATHLANCGARCWVVDRDQEAIDQLRATYQDADNLSFLVGDVGIESDVESCVNTIEAEAGGIHVLVNNAAELRDQSLVAKLGKKTKKHSTEDWNATIQSNLTGTFLMAREVAQRMIEGKRPGLIVNVSSVSRSGNPGQSAYSATKAAVDALTTTWAKELAYYSIRVVAIAPGFVETPMTKAIPQLFLDQIKQRTPCQRFGTLEEFGHAIQFIIENDYLNGKVLELDGGLKF